MQLTKRMIFEPRFAADLQRSRLSSENHHNQKEEIESVL
jgi:hypothetical protein